MANCCIHVNSEGKFAFYKLKVELKTTNEEIISQNGLDSFQVQYTDNSDLILEGLLEKFKGLSKLDFLITTVTPTNEQNNRLSDLNNQEINKEEALTKIDEFDTFVQFGYINKDTQIKSLFSLRDKYLESTNDYFYSLIEYEAKTIRKEYLNNAIVVKGTSIIPNNETMNTLNSLLSYLSTSDHAEMIDYKTETTVIKDATLDELKNIYNTVVSYIQKVRSAESNVVDYAKGLESSELFDFMNVTGKSKKSKSPCRKKFDSILKELIKE